jgi:hypothetical protein
MTIHFNVQTPENTCTQLPRMHRKLQATALQSTNAFNLQTPKILLSPRYVDF